MNPPNRRLLWILFAALAAGFSSCAQWRNVAHDAALKEKVETLVSKINDEESPISMHAEITSATEELIRMGLPALKYGVLDLLLSDDPITRLRAWRVLETILMERVGGEGKQSDERVLKVWKANGDYKVDAPMEARRASYEKWRLWLQKQ